MISQIGISMMVPVFLCGAIGYWLNNWLHQELLFLFMLFLGIGAAFRNLYLLTRSFYAEDLKKEQEKAAFLRELFLPMQEKVYYFYEHHFGIIGVGDTMVLDEMVIF